jgi:carbamoyl-phosphate synthase small subunit
MQALLALEDGRLFYGTSFGDRAEAGAEVVFCTAMTGYQEVLTDPSYHGQFVVFTAPHIGNYGIHEGHEESLRAWAAGVIVRDLSESPTHPAAVESLRHFVRRHHLCGMTDVDTRALTLHLRDRGVMRGYFTTGLVDPDEAVALARQIPPMASRDLVRDVTVGRIETRDSMPAGPRVAILDFGVKTSIVRELARRGCRVTVMPAGTDAATIDGQRPDGIVLSNGPGDPETLAPLLPTVRHCIDRYPTLAICLGHQLAGLALGGRTHRLPFGHHGANHPVKDVRTGHVAITSQNHNYAVDLSEIPSAVDVTHLNLNDGTVEGFVHRNRRLWSYQFHPEGAPGPHEARSIFTQFTTALGGTLGAA